MTNALTRLEDAVEAGMVGYGLNTSSVFGDTQAAMDAVDAFYGSLDAAKALHEAVLPSPLYQWHIAVEANFGGYVCNIFGCRQDRYIATTCNPNPARAWLLAIIRALAQVQPAREGDGVAK